MKRLIVFVGLLCVSPAFAGKVAAPADPAAAQRQKLVANKVPDKLIDQVIAWRADKAKFDADKAAACPGGFPKDGYVSTCPTAATGNWLAFQYAGFDNIPQGILAAIATEAAAPSDKGFLLRKLDPAKLEEQLGKEPNTYVKTIWIEAFYNGLAKFPTYKTQLLEGRGNYINWPAMDEGYKNADAMKAIVDFDRAWTKALGAVGGNINTWEAAWKPAKFPECAAIEAALFKAVPLDKEMTRQELIAAINHAEVYELMRLDSFCALLEGDLMKSEAINAGRDIISIATRDKNISPTGSNDFRLDFRTPFGGSAPYSLPNIKNDLTYYTSMNCNFASTGFYENSDNLHLPGGEVTTVKETPDGTVVTYKKASWLVDDIVCDFDNTLTWSNTGILERGRKCVKKGTKTLSHQEVAHIFPKGVKIPGLKPGMFLTQKSGVCANPKPPTPAFPFEVYPDHNLTNGTQRSFLWWTLKPAITGSAKAAPAAKGKAKK